MWGLQRTIVKILIRPPIFVEKHICSKVQGGFLVDPAPLDLRVLNSADFFLHVKAKVISAPSGMSGTLDLQVVGNIQPYKVCPSIPPKMARNSHVS